MREYTVKVIVATHKPYPMPDDVMYLPIHVGAIGKESIGYQRDNIGENISNRNAYFCELTGLYWAWKNLDEDYIGLVHYRRLFTIKGHTLNQEDIQPSLGNIKVFVPKKRRYYIETLKSHYAHTHYPEHLELAKSTIIKLCPKYLEAYEKAINRTWGYMFNMMIMEKTLLNDYCTWLFKILNDLFDQIDASDYLDFEKRYVGRISEILFNVWLEEKLNTGKILKNEIKELECKMEENWLVKIPAFLESKFFNKKYKGSF